LTVSAPKDTVRKLDSTKHTLDHVDCPVCAALENPVSDAITAGMPTDQALDAWYLQHLNYIAGQTPRTYRQSEPNLSDDTTSPDGEKVRCHSEHARIEAKAQAVNVLDRKGPKREVPTSSRVIVFHKR
jgi:hypothetical protein